MFFLPKNFSVFLLFGIFIFSGTVFSQELNDDFEENIVTDRPDQTEAPELTPKGWFQVEAGIQSEYDDNKETLIKEQNILYNTTLWKYGLSKNFEIRVITEFAEERRWLPLNDHSSDTFNSTTGMYPLKIGSKIFITKQKGILPNISLISHLAISRTGVPEFSHEHIIPEFRFVFSHDLNKYFKFSYNFGAEWEEESTAATGIYTAVLECKFTEKLSVFAESYGFLREQDLPDHRFDGGATVLLTNDLQLDCSAGIGLLENSPDYFISAGLSYRFNAFDKDHRK